MKFAKDEIVAKAIRIEFDNLNNKTYLIFEVISESFKQEIKSDWCKDTEVRLIGKNLIKG